MGTTDVPDGGPYSTAEHLRAQNEQLDENGKPLPSLAAGEQAEAPKTETPAEHTDEPGE